jgi:hypothetical protein
MEVRRNRNTDSKDKMAIYSYKKPGDYVVTLYTDESQEPIFIRSKFFPPMTLWKRRKYLKTLMLKLIMILNIIFSRLPTETALICITIIY